MPMYPFCAWRQDARRDVRVCFMREFMKMFGIGGERKGRSEDPEGCSHVFVSYPRCTGDAPSGACVHMCACIECVCLRRHQILPHNFRIFHWHTQSKPRTCANSFTDDRYSLARENKRKRTGSRILGGFLLCMVRRYNACEGYTRELRARGLSWIIEILVQGVVSCQASDSLLNEIYLLIISIFWSVAKVLSISSCTAVCVVCENDTNNKLQLRSFRLISYLFFA